MAEEERIWRQRHVHETNTVAYGSFGTATYNDSTQQWTFLRSDDPLGLCKDNEQAGTGDGARPLLRILGDPALITESSFEESADVGTSAPIGDLSGRYTELAAASSNIQTFLRQDVRQMYRLWQCCLAGCRWG